MIEGIQSLRHLKQDSSWSFSNLSKKETNYASHGYHKYPAKFIPQLVSKLLLEYSKKNDTVLDCFGGCGTTLVESKINERNSIALDVNHAALLITKAKKTAINPNTLLNQNNLLINQLSKLKIKKNHYLKAHPRLKYWFKEKQYNVLMEMFLIVKKVKEKRLRIFYECCFSDILKNCSIWYSKSIKPMRDISKPDYNPIEMFTQHLNFMTSQNKEYYRILKDKNLKGITSSIREGDARKTGLHSDSIDLIITSPPYAISYEYADLHQLTLLWFKFTENMNSTKQKFIGTASGQEHFSEEITFLAKKIVSKLSKKDKSLAKQISRYYSDLGLVYQEMRRILKKGKRACIILGDTEYKKVKIKNTEVSIELLRNSGFEVEQVIKRKLSSKTFTPYRDQEGKFTNSSHGQKKKIYQWEYIIIAKKQ